MELSAVSLDSIWPKVLNPMHATPDQGATVKRPDGNLPHNATEQLAAAVYAELRRIAAAQMARMPGGSTLQPTALVHEAWMRLHKSNASSWHSQSHFFAAAAESMRHILIDRARRRRAMRHGGHVTHVPLTEDDLPLCLDNDEHLFALDSAIDRLAAQHPEAAELTKLHCFAGIDIPEAARALGLTRATAYRRWVFARAWLFRELTS
jgi:RNA polymerase sigma factor (TIGR02999 family)